MSWRLGVSFFLFGLINNVLYVIILSAALDLVPASTPKGLIAFCNIVPSFIVKVVWPYLLKGTIRYHQRVIGCCVISVLGMIVVALSGGVGMRLLGISIASFSTGLGGLTFLQLTTAYAPITAGRNIGYFASGTGAAGLVGASLWWELRNFGTRTAIGLSSVLPLMIPFAYFFLLPQPPSVSNQDEEDDGVELIAASSTEYIPLPTDEDEGGATGYRHSRIIALSASDKWRMVKPMIPKYMLPLFCVYLFEYTINQGICPTLLYPVPSSEEHPVIILMIKSIRDYYPLWQLVYQVTVFLSRSSISLGCPPLPAKLLPVPAIIQLVILLALTYESAIGIFGESSEGTSFLLVFLLVSIEGICGGLAYVNAFYWINQEKPSSSDPEIAKQEKEFKIGSIGFPDSSGIILAVLVSMPLELGLCAAQVKRGKELCRSL
ncbi:batten's disease protein Cln3 [Thelephora ganbajun]|uniref:Batten's disease protein Cln3 n=1 Tax=Thelephora ganbajun TaxID=370292 RepID=A0ACB6ZEL6_THEGA|nr:batten's disease protein Cln3 [Thelephora ganbajun]